MDDMNKKKPNIYGIIATVCLVVAVISGGIYFGGRMKAARAEQVYDELADAVEATPTPEPTPAPTPEPTPVPTLSPEEANDELLSNAGIEIPEDKKVDFEDLTANVNPDIYAWIYIPDSPIDYPVLQHPTDDVYYLEYNIDGSKGRPGCIYTEKANAKDFSDRVTLMYGHNMRVGTMFAGLHNYEDPEYINDHKYVYIYMPDKVLVYEVLAAVEHSDEHLLLNHDFSDDYEFTSFMEETITTTEGKSNTFSESTVEEDDHILVLSTCITTKPSKRYLVVTRLVNSPEAIESYMEENS